MNTIMSRVTQVRTTAKGRLDQVRARVQGMGVGKGGMLTGFLPRTAPIKTYSRGMMQPRIMDRFRQTRAGGTQFAAGRANVAPIMTYAKGPSGAGTGQSRVAPIKTFAKENLRAIKTF